MWYGLGLIINCAIGLVLISTERRSVVKPIPLWALAFWVNLGVAAYNAVMFWRSL